MSKKLYYEYDNGEFSVHSKFIEKNKIAKESNGAKIVSIYKMNECELEQKLENPNLYIGEYITMYGLQ